VCLLCEAQDLEENMAEPWDALQAELLIVLTDGIKGFLKETKPELEAFLQEKAVEMAREKWRSLNASTESERGVAETNLRHLSAQVGGKVAELKLATTRHAEELIVKLVETAAGILLRIGPGMLGA
jgi:Mg-chelatase subunit ChlD